MESTEYDLIVIGGGPAGYVGAIRASQLGLNVACVEREQLLGGTCLRVGCIPSKALLESSHRFAELDHGLAEHGISVSETTFDLSAMMKRKDGIVRTLAGGVDGLFKKNGVERHFGHARLEGPGRVVVENEEGQSSLSAGHVLLATGGKSVALPGVEFDGDRVGTSTEALAYPEVPRRLIVIGAGFIGLELGSVWSRLGAEVIVLESLDRILPGADTELANAMQRILQKQGIEFRLGVRVAGARAEGDGAVVQCEGSDPIESDRVLVAVGRAADTENLGLESVGIETDARREIPVDQGFQTSAQGVYAVGDCIRGPKLAHKASHEAIACVERIVTGYGHVDYDTIPGVAYTDPEMAFVGRTEEQLREEGRDYRRGSFPFLASGRARALGQTDGKVKILADAKTDRILGVHILGPRAGDLIAEAAAAMQFGASSEDLARICHAHPTLAESLGEAALDVTGSALHVPPKKKRTRRQR